MKAIQLPSHTQEGNQKRIKHFSRSFHLVELPKLTAKDFKIAKVR